MAETTHIQQRQEYDLALTGIVDAAGNPASFDTSAGVPQWESSDTSIIDLRVADDGLSAVVGSLDTDGSVAITVTGDARMGPEVVPVFAIATVVVAPGDVAVFDFTAGPARPRSDADDDGEDTIEDTSAS